MKCRVVLLLALGSLAGGGSAAAQDLAEVRRLAQQGQVDSARGALNRLLAAASPADSTYPELLYTQGGLAASMQEMQRSYQRVAIEFPNSAVADDALLRLAQIDFAVNNPQGAIRQVERLRADYPDSPLRGIAALWGARAHFAMNNPAAGCVLLADGLARSGSDVELRNQLEFYRGRCPEGGQAAGGAVGQSDSGAPPRAVDSLPSAAPPVRPPASGWHVQLAAVAGRPTADELAAKVRAAGYPVQVVEEAGLFKVRAGPWSERAPAEQAIASLRTRFGGAPFLVRPAPAAP
ncbi:MAG: SPOR domain-containing protein [Gemmatimonadales bacterium]